MCPLIEKTLTWSFFALVSFVVFYYFVIKAIESNSIDKLFS